MSQRSVLSCKDHALPWSIAPRPSGNGAICFSWRHAYGDQFIHDLIPNLWEHDSLFGNVDVSQRKRWRGFARLRGYHQ